MVLKQVHDTNMRAKGHPERVFSVSHWPPNPNCQAFEPQPVPHLFWSSFYLFFGLLRVHCLNDISTTGKLEQARLGLGKRYV